MGDVKLKIVPWNDLPISKTEPVDGKTLTVASEIVQDVKNRGKAALLEHGLRFGDISEGDPLIYSSEQLQKAVDDCPADKLGLLENAAARISVFARAQMDSLKDFTINLDTGEAGQSISPMDTAGCYAPGGRFPLPSSVLMTAVTARIAGVPNVWVASPKPTIETLAAAGIAKADGLLTVGGAQAIAAMAYGAGPVPACDIIVGPGNRFVTAAKKLVYGQVSIDMVAGPSELLVLADGSANPKTVAADLLAQSEHDPHALPVLVSLDADLIENVQEQISIQLENLPTAPTAGQAVENGFAVLAPDLDTAINVCDSIAPEHLEVILDDPSSATDRLSHYGALFIGQGSAEVAGDYGAGPNHVLPTGGTARFTGGLSVHNFLRIRTWLTMNGGGKSEAMYKEAAAFARIEGLEGHARAAERRLKK